MNSALYEISVLDLAIAFIPIIPVLFILYQWRLAFGNAIYAISRMLLQLLIIGYFLAYIFAAENFLIVICVLAVMVFGASWIGLSSVAVQRRALYANAFAAITLGGGLTLVIISQGVLGLDPWYAPRFIIPLAGMIFANSMNSVSLAAERINSEMSRGEAYLQARKIAFNAALIPIVNSLFAVGIVSLPGMMTGQILSGVSPLIAARYQIVVMCMIFSSAGLSAIFFLLLSKNHFNGIFKSASDRATN